MTVRAFADPLLGIAGPPIEIARPERATLADLIALVPLDNEALRPHLRAKLGGVVIDPALYRRVLPKQDAFVTIVLPVHGGKNGILGTLAVIALVGASLFVGGGGLAFLGTAFTTGAVGANLVAGGLSLAASLLLQGLTAPQQVQTGSASKEIGVASAQNAFEPGAYLPRVAGTRKLSPPMVAPPFTQLDGDDQLVTAVYGLAWPHRWSGIKVGTADIDGAADIEYEVREGFADDEPLTLMTDTRVEVPLNIRLSQFRMASSSENTNVVDTSILPYAPQWHRVETKIDPDRAKLFLTFDQGLIYGGNDGTQPAITAVHLRIRRKGNNTWFNLPEFLVRGEKQNGAMRLFLDFEWRDTADMPGSVTAFSTNFGGWSWMYQTAQTSGFVTVWAGDAYFATNKIDWISKQQLKVYLDTAVFPRGAAYEIEVMRGFSASKDALTITSSTVHTITAGGITLYDFFGTASDGSDTKVPNAQSRFVDGLVIPAIQSIWDEYPFDLTGQPTALLAVRARNRTLDQVTAIASGYVSDWDGEDWIPDQITSNPASWYRHVLADDLNAEPTPPSLVGFETIQDWHAWCEANGLQLNAIFQGQPVDEVLSTIAQAGFARPRYGAVYDVVVDRARDPVGLITQRNASGFSFQKPFGRLPHALKVNLADEAHDYEVREVIVYADGYNADGSGGLKEATRFESATYPGITSEVLVTRRALRDLRFPRHRSRIINFSLDIEMLEHAIGDVVWLETDILGQIGGRGRVAQVLYEGGLVAGLLLDEERDFTHADDNELVRVAQIRQQDGVIRTEEVSTDDSDLNRIVFETPFAMPVSGDDDLIVPGTLVATGIPETRQVIIWDIAPGPQLTAQITAIDYAPSEIYGFLLLEEGGYLLLEDGGRLVLGD